MRKDFHKQVKSAEWAKNAQNACLLGRMANSSNDFCYVAHKKLSYDEGWNAGVIFLRGKKLRAGSKC